MIKYKTFWQRVVAGIIDRLIFFPITAINIFTASKFYSSISLIGNLMLILYFVYMHGKYGQTIGKRITGIKMFDTNERDVIGYKRAFYRESIWLGLALYSFFTHYISLSTATSIWFLLEILTMLFNTKRRAFQDYIGSDVIIDLEVQAQESNHSVAIS